MTATARSGEDMEYHDGDEDFDSAPRKVRIIRPAHAPAPRPDSRIDIAAPPESISPKPGKRRPVKGAKPKRASAKPKAPGKQRRRPKHAVEVAAAPGSARRRGRTRGPKRGRRLSPMERRWQRFYSGFRRDLERYQPVILFTALSMVLLAIYGMWTNGVFERAGLYTAQTGEEALRTGGVSVQGVTVRGREYVSEEEVLAMLDARAGQLLFDFDADAARARIESLPWVKTARVMRLLPDRLHVDLVERVPFSLWQINGEFRLIDREGVALTTLDNDSIGPFFHLPHVVGEGANLHAAELLAALEQAPVLKSRLRAANRIGDRRWDLRLDNGIDIRLPDTDVARAIRDVAALDSEHRLLARRISMIDLRQPDVLIIRPLKGATDTRPGWSGGRRLVIDDQDV